ncbi:MAG TPA: hypothetical protein VFE58_00075 [Tepidisphaeraceae bacterium]|nr:hypothetical protein [Tepidisphaeraceae bacterium]
MPVTTYIIISTKFLFRLLISFIAFVATYYFVYWLPCSLPPLNTHRSTAFFISLACAAAAGWFIWSHTRSLSKGLIASIAYGAILLGSIGFVAGFFGPIILTPDSNQGPLIGIFITGPAGALIGAIAGLIVWLIRRDKPSHNAFPVITDPLSISPHTSETPGGHH